MTHFGFIVLFRILFARKLTFPIYPEILVKKTNRLSTLLIFFPLILFLWDSFYSEMMCEDLPTIFPLSIDGRREPHWWSVSSSNTTSGPGGAWWHHWDCWMSQRPCSCGDCRGSAPPPGMFSHPSQREESHKSEIIYIEINSY